MTSISTKWSDKLPASNGGDAELEVAAGVLVVGDKLDKTTRARLKRLTLLIDNFEVYTVGRLWCNTAHLPCRCVADSDLCLSNGGCLLVRRHRVSNQSANLQLLRGLWM